MITTALRLFVSVSTMRVASSWTRVAASVQPLASVRDAKQLLSTGMARTALDESGEKGEFQRRDAVWRNWIRKDSDLPPESGRYHLYISHACPWAHRTMIVRALKGLQDDISVTAVLPTWQQTGSDDHRGWMFDDSADAKSVREIYERAGDTEGKYTVPILWDTHRETIVSNESADIVRMLNSEFDAKTDCPDLYPPHLQDAIDAVNAWIYPSLNNGVYRCGFAKSQEAYDTAIEELTQAFDRVDGILQKQRYIAGDVFTEADIRLFTTLVRFDEVYAVYFKTNTRSVAQTPSMLNYCREIYQMPGVKETVKMDHIKTHYYTSHPLLNHYAIIPRGADFLELLEMEHDRDDM